MTRALVVIDGEHYAPVLRDAIAALPYEVIGAWFAGGTEKLRGGEEYGVPLLEQLEQGFADAEVVVAVRRPVARVRAAAVDPARRRPLPIRRE